MAKVKGICRNIDGCSKARSRDVQEVEKTAFVCEECEKELKPISGGTTNGNGGEGGNGNGGKLKIVIAVVAVLAIGGLAAFFLFQPSDEDLPGAETVIVVDTPQADPVTEPAAEPVVESTPIAEPAVAEPVKQPVQKTVSQSAVSGTLTLPYGTYVGDIKNGRAEGQGKMTYNVRTLISKHDSKKRYAEPGEYVIGTWYGGQLDFGKLFAKNGDIKETLTIGRAE